MQEVVSASDSWPEDSCKEADAGTVVHISDSVQEARVTGQEGPANNINIATAANHHLICSWSLGNARVWWRPGFGSMSDIGSWSVLGLKGLNNWNGSGEYSICCWEYLGIPLAPVS